MLVSFYQGPPFKFDHSDSHHKNFVHAVRYPLSALLTHSYSPDGAYFVSVCGDKTINLFEGKVGSCTLTPPDRRVPPHLLRHERTHEGPVRRGLGRGQQARIHGVRRLHGEGTGVCLQ